MHSETPCGANQIAFALATPSVLITQDRIAFRGPGTRKGFNQKKARGDVM